VWSERLSAQIGEEEANAQIKKDAEDYRARAEKAQHEAAAAAAAAAAAEADAQAAADRAVAADFNDMINERAASAAAKEHAA